MEDKLLLKDLISRLRSDLEAFGGLTANRLYLLNEMLNVINDAEIFRMVCSNELNIKKKDEDK